MQFQQTKFNDYLNVSEEKRECLKEVVVSGASKLQINYLLNFTKHGDIKQVDLKKVWSYRKEKIDHFNFYRNRLHSEEYKQNI